MEEQRTTELRRGPPGPPPPWYREHWWVWLVALLLIVGGIIAFFALRGNDEEQQGGARETVPNVVGLQEREARAQLDDRGFAVETEREAHEGAEGTVVAQRPSPGSRLARGARVRITVSTGPAQTATQTQTETQTVTTETETTGTTETQELTDMPDVTGTEYPDAVEQLLDAGLLPNSFPVESDEERGNVADQRPEAGARVALGSAVRIDVSLGSGSREQRTVPDLTGQPLADALQACAEAGFTCRAVPEGGAGREVTAQRPVSGGSLELSQIELSTG